MTLAIGALLGFISIALGAYAEHGLKLSLSESALSSLTIALRYHQSHAIVIACLLNSWSGHPWICPHGASALFMSISLLMTKPR